MAHRCRPLCHSRVRFEARGQPSQQHRLAALRLLTPFPLSRALLTPQDKVDAMITHLAGLSDRRLIISFAPKTLSYSILKRIGELFPGPSKVRSLRRGRADVHLLGCNDELTLLFQVVATGGAWHWDVGAHGALRCRRCYRMSQRCYTVWPLVPPMARLRAGHPRLPAP